MREIKFRAWGRTGEWEEDGENQKYEMCYDIAFEDFEPINDLLANVENLMQYIGLKDKNGKEIYEGDIFKWQFGYVKDIMWDEELNGWNIDKAGLTTGEVIGNIYENKDYWSKTKRSYNEQRLGAERTLWD